MSYPVGWRIHRVGRGHVTLVTRRKAIGVRAPGPWGLAIAIVELAMEEGDTAAIDEWKEWLDERQLLAEVFRARSRATAKFSRMTPVAHGDESIVYLKEKRRKAQDQQ